MCSIASSGNLHRLCSITHAISSANVVPNIPSPSPSASTKACTILSIIACESSYTPFQSEFPTGPLCHLQLSRLHHRPGGGDPGTSPPRWNAIRDLKYGVGHHLPSGRFAANGAWLMMAHGSLDGAHRSGRAGGDHQDPPTTVLLPRRTAHPLRRLTLHLPRRWPWENQFSRAARLRALPFPT